MPAAQAANPTEALSAQKEDASVRLHITPLKPDLLKVYLAPSVLTLAKNISYHIVETFPEKGYGYVELPESEAQKLKKKLNGTTLRGAKVRIEMAKPEKRKAREEADAAKDKEEADRPSKRVKKEKRKKEAGVIEGAELENERKVKRGWTEPPTKGKKERKEKKDKDKDQKHEQKKSKYTKEPELLFKAKLTPVAATEVARKEKKKEKKEKKDKKSKSREVVVHEFEKNTKTPSFLKETKVAAEKKPAVEYVNGQGWVDEDGNVVEPETGKARNRRVLELVDRPVETEPKKEAASPKAAKANKKKPKATPPPSSSESEAEDDDSSVVSSSSEDLSSSDSEADESDAKSAPSTPVPATSGTKVSEATEATGAAENEVHPLEALFKRAKPSPGALDLSTPKKLTPINTTFSFFENDDKVDVDTPGEVADNAPTTPFTERDLEWRGLRSAAPTPDTAAIGRRFSFDWRKGSQEADDDEDDDEDMADAEAEQQLSKNTKANASNQQRLPGVAEEDEDDAEAGAGEQGVDEKPESEFRKWFWENRGDLNRSWKKRRRDALKAKRLTENRKMTPHRKIG
jgi:hypothetical protein